ATESQASARMVACRSGRGSTPAEETVVGAADQSSPTLFERQQATRIGGHRTPPMRPAHSPPPGPPRIKHFYRPLASLPGEIPSGQVTRVKSRLAQGSHHLASNMKSVDAKRDDRLGLRELAHPFVDPVGVAPDRRLHHVRGPAAGVPGPRIDDLHRRSLVE